MSKMPSACENHWQTVLVAGCDHFVIALRTTRLYDRRHASPGRKDNRVAEREECIAGKDRTAGPVARLANRNFHGVDTAHLSRAYAYKRAILVQRDGITTHMAYHRPAEAELRELLGGGLFLRDNLPFDFRVGERVCFLNQETAVNLPVLQDRGVG